MKISKLSNDVIADKFRVKLQRFNEKAVLANPEIYDKSLHFQLLDPSDEVQGVVLGATYRGYLYIELLWVEERHRNKGLASQLMNQIELAARDMGVLNVHLDTFSFQAPEFYLKRGYEIAGKLEGFDDGVVRYTMYRKLSSA